MPAAAKPATLAAALVAAQAAMPAVDKDATNPHFRSKFTSLDHLIALTRPVLNAHGLAITQLPSGTTDEPTLTTTIVHSDSGEIMVEAAPLFLGKRDMQGLGAALTYARRYAWASACGIASEEDDDGNSASARGVSEAAPPKAAGGADPAAATAREKLLSDLDDLADKWKALKPDYDKAELTRWLGKQARSEGELKAAIDTVSHNIEVATSEFRAPAGVVV